MEDVQLDIVSQDQEKTKNSDEVKGKPAIFMDGTALLTAKIADEVFAHMSDVYYSEKKHNSNNFRKLYMEVFTAQTTHYNQWGKPNWWYTVYTDAILAAGKKLLAPIRLLQSDNKSDKPNQTIKIGDTQIASKKLLIIGSHEGCDIRVHLNHISRVAAIVYFMYEINRIFIIDVGSNNGITVHHNGTPTSKPTMHNNVCMITYNQSVFVDIGKYNIGIECSRISPFVKKRVCPIVRKTVKFSDMEIIGVDDMDRTIDSPIHEDS